MSVLGRLGGRKLVVVTGKGGVGKSTLASVLGQSLAERGRRTLVLEVDPRESLYSLLGTSPSGGEPLEAGNNLYLQNLRPESVMQQVVREHIRVDFLARRLAGSPIYRHFTDGAPGLKALAVLAHALRAGREGLEGVRPVDVVVLDAPATGHGIDLLTAPGLVSEVIGGGPFGRIAEELTGFVADPDRCGIVVATGAEEMPVQEAMELIVELDRRFGRRPELVAVNAVYPPADRFAAGGDDEAGDAAALRRHRREANEREIRRLRERWDGPLVVLPLLPVEEGPGLVAALGERLVAALDEPREVAWT